MSQEEEIKGEVRGLVDDCTKECGVRVLSDEKRSNVQEFQKEAKENRSKTAIKRKLCGVQTETALENCRGAVSVFRGVPGLSQSQQKKRARREKIKDL